MRSEGWSVEDVMSYFGEFFGSKEEAERAMEICKSREHEFYRLSYKQRMNVMRHYLNELGHDVIFRTGYRRIE